MELTFKQVVENYDRIELERISFYAYHGHLHEEANLGQRFEIDVEVFLDLEPAAASDELQSALNYYDLFQTVYRTAQNTRFRLIEALGKHICDQVFEQYAPVGIRIRIRKLQPPIPDFFGTVSVEICRVHPRFRGVTSRPTP
jgi:dihydroneopterin aldolase